jgi:hypothetical protein
MDIQPRILQEKEGSPKPHGLNSTRFGIYS